MKHSFLASKHSCYIDFNRYKCECGHKSIGLYAHNKHVFSHKDKELVKRNWVWKVYLKEYKPEEYKRKLKELREEKRRGRK